MASTVTMGLPCVELLDNIIEKMNKNINNNGYGYVDLKLPSGTLWAAMNVGASNSEETGLYFQWGDTQGYTAKQVGKGEGKKYFSWDTYKWDLDGYGVIFKKYNVEGIVLDLEDDAAHVHMGGDWHIPNENQIEELIDNTASDWISQNGTYGGLFTSKNDKSKSIFIPAVGYAFFDTIYFSGEYGYVWGSKSMEGENLAGKSLYFSSERTFLYRNQRFFGLPVRGVIG